MQLYLAKRHWFGNDATLKALEDAIPALEQTAELGKSRRVNLSLLVSSDETKLNNEMKARASLALSSLSEAGWNVQYNSQNQTASSKFVQLFDSNVTSNSPVFSICCMDQYPLFREEHWDAAISLAEKLVKDKKAYANGSRNVPVVLGVNQEASDMRIIHEIINTLASGEGTYPVKEIPSWANPSPAYAKFGESTSGFYFINPHGKDYLELKKQIEKNREITLKPGFALEYATSIMSGMLDTVSSGYVYAEQNAFYAKISSEEEKAKIASFINREVSALRWLPVAPALRKAVSDNNLLSRLHDYFTKEQVQEVTGIMQKALLPFT